jgi:hypothetical protein
MTGGDLLITAALFVFLVIAVLADSINLLAGPGPISDATLASLPHFEAVKAAFVWFSRDVDPLLRMNPPWFYAMMMLNLGSVSFYVFAISRFIKGKTETVRGPALFWSGSMLSILFVIVFEELFGPHPTKNRLQFALAYGGYILVPVIVLFRFWNEEPAGRKKKAH